MAVGTTYWGKTWLESLLKAEKNLVMIQRGRQIFEKGLVKKLNLDLGSISTLLQDLQGQNFATGLSFKPYSELQIKKFKSIVTGYPSILTEIFNGVLPKELIPLLENAKIKLIPTSWREIDSNCSCSDTEDPCKHVIALIFAIGHELDENPLYILKIRGLDVDSLIDEAGTQVSEPENIGYGQSTIIPEVIKSDPSWDGCLTEVTVPNLKFEVADIRGLLDIMPNPKFALEEVLPIRYELRTLYEKVTNAVSELFPLSGEEAATLQELDFYITVDQSENTADFNPRIWVSNPEILTSLGLMEEGYKIVKKKLLVVDENDLYSIQKMDVTEISIKELWQIGELLPLFDHPDAMPCMTYLSQLTALTFALLKNKLYYPGIKLDDSLDYSIVYQPLVNNPQIDAAIRHCADLMPYNMVSDPDEKVVYLKSITKEFLSIFITEFINQRAHEFKSNDINIGGASSHLINAFISGKKYSTQSFEEQINLKSLTDWLKCFAGSTNTPYFIEIYTDKISETEYEATLYLVDKEEIEDGAFTLDEIFESRDYFAGLGNRQLKQSLSILADNYDKIFPEFQKLISGKPLSFGLESYFDFLSKYKEILTVLGITIYEAENSPVFTKPKLAWVVESIDLEDDDFLIDAKIEIRQVLSVNGEQMDRADLTAIVLSGKRYPDLNGNVIMLNPDDAIHYLEVLNQPTQSTDFLSLLYGIATGFLDGYPILHNKNTSDILRILSAKNISVKDYIAKYTQSGLGCIIQDLRIEEQILLLADLNKLPFYVDQLTEKPNIIIDLFSSYSKIKTILKSIDKSHRLENVAEIVELGKDIVPNTIYYADLSFLETEKAHSLADEAFGSLILINGNHLSSCSPMALKNIKNIFSMNKILMMEGNIYEDLYQLYLINDCANPGYLPVAEEYQKEFVIEINTFKNEAALHKLKMAVDTIIYP